MSGWGDNPFETDKFDDDGTNPFTDQSGAEPAAEPSSKKKKRGGATKLADVNTFKPKKSAYNAYDPDDVINDADRFAADVVNSDVARRERELQEREKALIEREKRAEEIEREFKPNYPPFPTWCCIKPWVVHRIRDEIPDSFKRQQRIYFIYFHFWILLMWLNVIGCGIQMQTTSIGSYSKPLEDPLVSLVLSIVYAIFVVPIGFYTRYWSLYRAVKLRSSIRMIFHLVNELVNIGWSGMMCSGAWKTGGAGFEGAMLLVNADYKVTATCIYISAGLWLLDAVISTICFFYFWYFWRNGGLNFKDATAETVAGAASSKTLRNAAREGMRNSQI